MTANEPNHPPSSRSSTSHQRSTLSKCKLAISSVVGVVAVADAVWGAHWQRFDNTTCGLVRVFHTTDELKSLAVLSQCFPLRRHDPKGIESYKAARTARKKLCDNSGKLGGPPRTGAPSQWLTVWGGPCATGCEGGNGERDYDVVEGHSGWHCRGSGETVRWRAQGRPHLHPPALSRRWYTGRNQIK